MFMAHSEEWATFPFQVQTRGSITSFLLEKRPPGTSPKSIRDARAAVKDEQQVGVIEFLAVPHALLTALQTPLSPARLARYQRSPSEPPERALARYVWNIRLAEALYPSLNNLEVALRNSLHAELTRQHGPHWYDAPWLAGEGARKVAAAKTKLKKRKRQVTPDRIVAELTLGFWVALFYRDYEKHVWQTKGALKRVLPRVNPTNQRQVTILRPKLVRVLALRNRVFHHEPIWLQTDLLQAHTEIHEVIAWLSPHLSRLTREADRFDALFAAGERCYEPEIRKHAAGARGHFTHP